MGPGKAVIGPGWAEQAERGQGQWYLPPFPDLLTQVNVDLQVKGDPEWWLGLSPYSSLGEGNVSIHAEEMFCLLNPPKECSRSHTVPPHWRGGTSVGLGCPLD